MGTGEGVRGVLFDMDDTLISRREAFRRYAEKFYGAHPGLHETAQDEAIALMTEWDGRGDNDKRVYFGRIKCRWPGVEAPIPQLIDEFWQWTSEAVRPDERVRALLRQLNEAAVPWGIVTNGPESQLEKMRRGGLDGLAPFALVSGMFGHRKPDRRIFEEALRLLDCAAGETLFVGDNPQNDIRGALALGMRAAWVRAGRTWSWGEPAPDWQIEHVAELRPLLLGRA